MKVSKFKINIFFAVIICAVSTLTIFAQEDFYKVYQYETPLAGHTEITAWNTFIGKSRQDLDYFGRSLSRNHLLAHSIEAEYGVTDHFTVGAYADFEDPRGGGFNLTRGRVVGRYRFKQRYDKFFNTAVYAEYYFPRKSEGQELEMRLIMDKDVNDFRFVLNPTLTKVTTGDKGRPLRPGFTGGAYYRRKRFAQPGLEFYSDFKEKTATVFPTVDVFATPTMQWNFGVGFGLTGSSDRIVFKSVLSFDVLTIRPSKLFRKPFKTTKIS